MAKTYTITVKDNFNDIEKTTTYNIRTCTAVAVSIYKAVKANKASREVEA